MNQKANLFTLLNQFEIPEMRREITKSNLHWLLRNLPIKNGNNPHFFEAMRLVKEVLKEIG